MTTSLPSSPEPQSRTRVAPSVKGVPMLAMAGTLEIKSKFQRENSLRPPLHVYFCPMVAALPGPWAHDAGENGRRSQPLAPASPDNQWLPARLHGGRLLAFPQGVGLCLRHSRGGRAAR